MSLQKQTPTEKPPVQENGVVEWFLDEFVPRYGKQTLYVLVGLAVVVAGGFWFKSNQETQEARENKELGSAFLYAEDNADSAEAFLTTFVQKSHSRPVQ